VITPAVAFTVCLILACLRIGSPWTAAAALIAAGILLAAGTDRQLRRAGRSLDQMLAGELGIRRPVPPAPDLAFLGPPPPGCAWCTDLSRPGDPRDCTCTQPCPHIGYCNASGWAASLMAAVKDGDHE
jgi:hypothetical protein